MSKDERMTKAELLEFSITIIKDKYSTKKTEAKREYMIKHNELSREQEVAFNIMCADRNELMRNDPFCDRHPFIEVEIEQYKKRYYLAKEHKRRIAQLSDEENLELETNLKIFYDIYTIIY